MVNRPNSKALCVYNPIYQSQISKYLYYLNNSQPSGVSFPYAFTYSSGCPDSHPYQFPLVNDGFFMERGLPDHRLAVLQYHFLPLSFNAFQSAHPVAVFQRDLFGKRPVAHLYHADGGFSHQWA